MNRFKLNKDQIQKIGLSLMGLVFLLYVYFTFFLGPLNRSRRTMMEGIKDRQTKLDASVSDLSKATTLENQAKNAITRYAALKALNAEGAPIAWFPPRMKTFFGNQQIDKAAAKLESTSAARQSELTKWSKYNWIIDLPQADYATLGRAISALENAEPLLAINRLNIMAVADQPQFQQVTVFASNVIEKK